MLMAGSTSRRSIIRYVVGLGSVKLQVNMFLGFIEALRVYFRVVIKILSSFGCRGTEEVLWILGY